MTTLQALLDQLGNRLIVMADLSNAKAGKDASAHNSTESAIALGYDRGLRKAATEIFDLANRLAP